MKILMLNGPNLDLLGTREPDVYGRIGLDEIEQHVAERGRELGVEVEAFQSNEEGVLVSRIGRSSSDYDGIIFNPAAYTHTSVALCDALRACDLPCVEVHMSNIYGREEFRQKSLTAPACLGQISGFGPGSYVLALEAVVGHLRKSGEGGGS